MKLKYNDLIFDLNGDVNLDNYYTKSECDNKYALKSHSHNISDITNLQSTLNGKSNTNHTHSNYATTTALNEVRNLANGKLANIDTHKHVINTIGKAWSSNNADAYLNKNLHVRHNCLGKLSGSCGGGSQWVSITQNGYEIFRHNNESGSDTGLNAYVTLLFTTSDVFKMTTSYRQTELTIQAIGTDSNLYY